MNVPAHLLGQISGQVPNQVGQQVSGPSQLAALSSQMQSLGAHMHRMDPDLLIKRRRTQDFIIQYLQRKNHNPNSEVMQKISDLARRLEELIYKDTILQGEDYSNMSSTTIEQRLQGITKIFNIQQHIYMSSSAVSTMIPTPGMTSYGNKGPAVSQDNTMITTTGGGMLTQTAVSVGNMLHNVKGSVGMGQIASFNVSTGSILNGYQQPPVNIVHNSSGNTIMSSMGMMLQSSQMIPTSGVNNPHSMSIGSESSCGGGFSSIDSSMVSQQQQKQYVGSQNNRLLQGLGMGVGIRSNIHYKPSPYNFHNMNGSMGGNAPTATEGYLGPVSYGGSPKPLQQQLDKQQHQSLAPTPMSQQMLPLAGDGYVMNTSDLSMTGNIYSDGSTAVSIVNNHNLNPSMSLKSKTNNGMLAHHTSHPSMQHTPQMKCQMLDSSQGMNFQSTYSAREQLLQSQHQMQNFRHQQFQQSDQPTAELVQYTRYQQNQQSQQLISNMDNLMQSSAPSNFVGQLIPEDGIESTNESLLSQTNEQLCLSELQNQYQLNTSSVNLSKGAKLLCQIQGTQDFQPSSSSQVSQQIWEADQ